MCRAVSEGIPMADPFHGKTLQSILEGLVDHYGWEVLSERIKINCFTSDPSVSSSLVFLRKTPWARKKVERLYLEMTRPSAPKKNGRATRKNDEMVAPDTSEMPPLDIGL